VSYQTLYSVDDNVHEGWNTYYWNELNKQPRFTYYRYAGKGAKSCEIKEIELSGIEGIDDDKPDY